MSAIDPGLAEPIQQTSNDVEANIADSDREEQLEEEKEEDFQDPSRWWFASTACPLLAGTFGPIASGFNICALVYKWRLYIPPGGTEEHGVILKDPTWLVAINAVSLLCAVVGNLSLLLNMARRLDFQLAQPITISGFLLASLLLIADTAALTASPTYHLTGMYAPHDRHALSSAFYYAIFAAVIYMIIALLMCMTVYGAKKGYYDKCFQLTPSQRTLMLQTMSFMAYLLLGALVYSKIEGWSYLNAVYWADVTLLTVGFGDFSPATPVGRGLVFPFAIGGILMVGLVVGSIRSLILERGKEKLSARITEKRRYSAVHNVDSRKQTIRISSLATADFSADPSLSPAQRREEEFKVMRKVQAAAERERRYFSLLMSSTFAFLLWFVGAAIFMVAENNQQWTYFNALYFSYISLLTIGYGDSVLLSNSGRAFFVIWSILAVPSLTILISNMGDTIIKWFSDATIWLGSITVLPGEHSIKATGMHLAQRILNACSNSLRRIRPPGISGDAARGHTLQHEKRMSSHQHEERMMDCLAKRLTTHIASEELQDAKEAEAHGDTLQRDIHFYHYVLARECRNLMKELGSGAAKQYTWEEWEYFLKLMDNEDDASGAAEHRESTSEMPQKLQQRSTGVSKPAVASGTDGAVDREHEMQEWKRLHEGHKRNKLRSNPDGISRPPTTTELTDWSWLSNKSPLMSTKSETEWILERLSAVLETELRRQRKGLRKAPPVSMANVKRRKASSANANSTTEGVVDAKVAKQKIMRPADPATTHV
ncbi:voltage-gated potassium channel [Hortaea werneckii]|nr:voltage-gated potassium channel [Hortaea werneckii]KAI7060322.1 voltage-gated potassium channel [Hortaea werneckii]KAI7211611.1 voltage-gated potassium channel [Hortaea werneckii]KAI7293016.1 voltage-gated potassium channel [Hortaea werneckii]KAI7378184.1 voltage-gated potassium channel [Hortaea werneckii]